MRRGREEEEGEKESVVSLFIPEASTGQTLIVSDCLFTQTPGNWAEEPKETMVQYLSGKTSFGCTKDLSINSIISNKSQGLLPNEEKMETNG